MSLTYSRMLSILQQRIRGAPERTSSRQFSEEYRGIITMLNKRREQNERFHAELKRLIETSANKNQYVHTDLCHNLIRTTLQQIITQLAPILQQKDEIYRLAKLAGKETERTTRQEHLPTLIQRYKTMAEAELTAIINRIESLEEKTKLTQPFSEEDMNAA